MTSAGRSYDYLSMPNSRPGRTLPLKPYSILDSLNVSTNAVGVKRYFWQSLCCIRSLSVFKCTFFTGLIIPTFSLEYKEVKTWDGMCTPSGYRSGISFPTPSIERKHFFCNRLSKGVFYQSQLLFCCSSVYSLRYGAYFSPIFLKTAIIQHECRLDLSIFTEIFLLEEKPLSEEKPVESARKPVSIWKENLEQGNKNISWKTTSQ